MPTPAGRFARLRTNALRLTLLACIAMGGTVAGCGGGGPIYNPQDYLLAPEKVHYGGSYSDWSVLWWQWALEQPYEDHPLFDQIGDDAGRNQVEPVWFIGGVFFSYWETSTGFAERTITLPANAALFFPIINGGFDNQTCLPPGGWTPRSASELAELTYELFNRAVDLYCTLDGVDLLRSPDITGALRFRAISGTFEADLPDHHIAVAACGDAPGALHLDPAVSDGIWMMLDPLPAGEHTIAFGAGLPTIPGPGVSRFNIIYHITVLP